MASFCRLNSSMKWSNENVLKFLNAYRMEPCIWDPRNADNKNRRMVALAWKNIHRNLNFNCTVNELKKKRDSLMASFRTLLNKKKKHLNLGGSPRRHFEPHWFAYRTMENFLGPVYLCHTKIKTETTSIAETEIHHQGFVDLKIEDISNDATDNNEDCEEMSDIFSMPVSSSTAKRKRNDNEEFIYETNQILEEASTSRRPVDEENDDCYLYCQLLAKRLRKFDENQREEIMLEIDGLIVQKRKALLSNTLI